MKKMKFTLLLTLSIFFTFSSPAQEQGTLQANFSGLPLFDFDQGYSGFVLNPGFRYQLGEKTAIGTNFFYYFQNDVFASGIPSNIRGYGFVPSIRYSLISGERFNFFAEAGVGFGATDFEARGSDNSNFPVDENNGALLIINAGFGINYKLTDQLGLELTIPYIKADNITNRFFSDVYDGVGALFGVTYDFRLDGNDN